MSIAARHARDKTLATREDLNAALSEIRKDIRTIYRILVIGFIGGFGTVIAALIGGFGAIIGKLYFGV